MAVTKRTVTYYTFLFMILLNYAAASTTTTQPTVTPIDCGPVTRPFSASVNYTSGTTISGSNVTYSCSTGYALKGEATRTCTDDGTWSGYSPTCISEDCGELPSLINGSVTYSGGTTYRSPATFSCDEGYMNVGSTIRTCYMYSSYGRWSGQSTTCQIVEFSIRLAGGDTSKGRVEVSIGTEWGTVCDRHWDAKDAKVVCTMLGYSNGIALFKAYSGNETSNILMDDVQCQGTEDSLIECSYIGWGSHDCNHMEDASVICYTNDLQVRLVGGNRSTEGRLEVLLNGFEWGTVCGFVPSWNEGMASVVCGMLSYSNISAVANTILGPGTGGIFMAYIYCTGEEASLLDCMVNDGVGYCTRSSGVSVVCSNESLCNDTHDCTLIDDHSVCNQSLGVCQCNDSYTHIRFQCVRECRYQPFLRYEYVLNNTNIILGGTTFYQSFTLKCYPGFTFGTGEEYLNISCLGNGHFEDFSSYSSKDFSVRLDGGNSDSEGRVEVTADGTEWRTLCGNAWDPLDALVVCKMLGYRNARVMLDGYYGYGNGRFFYRSINCKGTEGSLIDCPFYEWNATYCHYRAPSVSCFNAVGILQVQSNVSTANEGTGLSVTCDVTAIAYTSAENTTIWWKFNGNRVLPTRTSRFQISSYELELGKLTSVLTVRSVRKTDEGIYECIISEPGQNSSSDTTVAVIAKPVVSVQPRSQTLDSGASVNITCTILSPTDHNYTLVFYKDGVKLNSDKDRSDDASRTAFYTDEIVEQTGTMVTLTITNVVRKVVYGCEGQNIAGVGIRQSSSIWVLDTEDDVVCDEETINGVQWPVTAPGGVALAACMTGFTGEIRRKCNTTGWLPPQNFCVRDQVSAVQTQINQIKDGSGRETVGAALQPLVVATEDVQLTEGELLTTQDILDVVADINEATDVIDEQETERFLEIASNVIDTINYPSWQSEIDQEHRGAISVARVVERYLHSVGQKQLTEDDYVKRYQTRNLYTEIGRGRRGSYGFPNTTDGSILGWVDSTRTGISVPGESLENLTVVEYTSALYRNMSGILTRKLKRDGEVVDVKDEMDLNADIVSFKVANVSEKLSPPAVITFEHFDSYYSKPVCVYWDFGERAWSTEGCSLISNTDEYTECACDHFTNFAVLMSPGKTPETDMLALSIISAVGCGISMLCIVILLILFGLVWRYIKSDRHVLMVHLCIALLISYALFLGGINRAENKDVCTAIAALLHYFYLVVFFLMLGFGVEIAVAVIYVFATKSRLKWLLPLAWGIPAVIVAVSLGVTQLEGYGNDQFCWLSIENGLLWAFVGPAALVLLINFIIVIVVFKKMFGTSTMLSKTDREKAKTSLRSMCVLLPILGLTWVFGIFSVNESLVVFQYIFAVCNSLQGLFIILFHGILNHQLHDALRRKRTRKRSLATIDSSLKPQSSSAGQTTFIKDDSTTRSDSDLLKPKGSNPFLEVDRQVQKLVKKNKKGNKTQGNRLYGNAVKNNFLDKPTQSRTDGYYKARMKKHMDRKHNVYFPEAYESSEAAKQARVRVAEAMPITYNPKASKKDSSTKKLRHSGKANDMAAAKKQHQSKKKPSKDRSKAYQYQYEMEYMGNSSRHASLENVSMHISGFNPYAGPSMHHYQQQGQH